MNNQEAQKVIGKKYTFCGKKVTVKNVYGSEYSNQTVLMQDEDGAKFEITMSTFTSHCKAVVEEVVNRTSDAWFFIFMKNLVAGYYDNNLAQNQIQAIKDIRTLYSEANPYMSLMSLMDAKNLMEMAREWRKLGKKSSATNEVIRTELRNIETSTNVIRRQLGTD